MTGPDDDLTIDDETFPGQEVRVVTVRHGAVTLERRLAARTRFDLSGVLRVGDRHEILLDGIEMGSLMRVVEESDRQVFS